MTKPISRLSVDIGLILKTMEPLLVEAEAKTGKKAYEMALIKSSGPFSYAMLAAMDHPYAKRHGAPQSDPSTINLHTGRFRADWVYDAPMWTSNVLTTSVTNDNPVAVYLKNGTKVMFNRPIDDFIINAIVPIRAANLDKAFQKSFAILRN